MTENKAPLFKSEDGELFLYGKDPKVRLLLTISFNNRNFYLSKYPEILIQTLEKLILSNKQQLYFDGLPYSGSIDRRGKDYRIHIESENKDLTLKDLICIIQTIRDYFCY